MDENALFEQGLAQVERHLVEKHGRANTDIVCGALRGAVPADEFKQLVFTVPPAQLADAIYEAGKGSPTMADEDWYKIRRVEKEAWRRSKGRV